VWYSSLDNYCASAAVLQSIEGLEELVVELEAAAQV
jgi:hypothetical protein